MCCPTVGRRPNSGLGDTFGEIALLSQVSGSASVTARTPMRLLSLLVRTLSSIPARVPELERSLRRLGVSRAGRASLVQEAQAWHRPAAARPGPDPGTRRQQGVPDRPRGRRPDLLVRRHRLAASSAPGADLFDDQGDSSSRTSPGRRGRPTTAAWSSATPRPVGRSVDPTAVPWVRLSAASTTPGQLGEHQHHPTNLHDSAGSSPLPQICSAIRAGTVAEVPYTADYYFWK